MYVCWYGVISSSIWWRHFSRDQGCLSGCAEGLVALLTRTLISGTSALLWPPGPEIGVAVPVEGVRI